MRWTGIALLLAACGILWAELEPVQKEGPARDAPIHKGLEVHEWGVWRVHQDLDLANADMRAVWAGLPRFVYGQVAGRELPKHWQSVLEVDRPILFFHTPDALEAELRIDFPGGLAGVWWPGTEQPAIHNGQIPTSPSGKPWNSLTWRLRLKDKPPGRADEVAYAPVDAGHWIDTLRKVKADDVFAHVNERGFGCERERFVYYDGLLPRGTWATIVVDKERITVANAAKHPLHDVTIVDRRTSGKTRLARLANLDAGAAPTLLKFDDAPEGWPKPALRTLIDQLHNAGLNEDEAAALVELGKDELFLSEGLTLFYRLPQEEYDRQLPLTMNPRPEKLVRVGLVVHPYCEPDLADRVAVLVKDLDNDSFPVREAAEKRLATMGRAAFVHLVRLRKQVTQPEARQRLERLLEKYDAERALPR